MSARRTLRWVLAAWLLLAAVPRVAQAQIDPERRTYLQLGGEVALRGDAPITGYAFLLLNRPDAPAEHWYTRVIVSPVYVTSEIVRDQWPVPGMALGAGLGGGLLAAKLDEFRRGDYKARESFWGHPVDVAFSTYFLRGVSLGPLPLEGQVRVRPQYVAYTEGIDTDRHFRLPEDSVLIATRAGLRLGGVPPQLSPSAAAEVSLYYEASYRDRPGRYGLPERPEETAALTQSVWGRAGAVLPLFERHTASLFLGAGTAEQVDALSAFRLGGALSFRREFPLLLHGYAVDEVFARRYVLLNASYHVPLPIPVVPLGLRLSADWALVDPLRGHDLPRRSLTGVGVDLDTRLGSRTSLVVGYGHGIDAPRGRGFGGHEASVFIETRF